MARLHQLSVHLLGGFAIALDGQPLAEIKQPRQQSLLAYLMLQARIPQSRQHVAFLFWPDFSEERAFANLRYALHHLRQACPEIDRYLESTSTSLCWRRRPSFQLDVAEYENLITLANKATARSHVRDLLTQAVNHYRGDLLPGCYDDWIIPVREWLGQSYIQALHQLVDLLAEEEAYETAVPYAHQLRTSDPFREQSYRRLMTLHEARGDRAAALRIYHDCVTILERELGVEPSPETQAIYARIINRTTLRSAPGPSQSHIMTAVAPKLVGRETEWQILHSAWQKASQGQPHLVLIQGEAGIGKTYLAEALLTGASQHGHLTIHTRAYAAEGQLAYSPVIEWLRAPAYTQALTHLEDVWLTECARLMPEILSLRSGLAAPAPLTDSWQRQRLFEGLARAALAPQQPLLVLLDDLQWADRETLEWLHFLLRFDASAALLLVGTVRMSEVAAEHPLTTLQQQFHRDGRIQEIALAPLAAAASDELAQQIAGSHLEADTLDALHRYAEGVPLFLVEAVRAEINKHEEERWRWLTNTALPAPGALPLPPKVYTVIQARLNQLSPGARQLAHVAAVIGRAFSSELLALASQSDEERLVQNLDELWQRHIVREQGANYDFSHDRIRDVMYAGIPPVQRKRLHHQVAEALVQRHGAHLDDVSPQLANHYEAAGLFSQAVDCYFQAGEAAQGVYAHDQACELLRRGIALIRQLPATEQRNQQALSLYAALATSLQVIKGWTSAEVHEAIDRAWQLSHQLNDTYQLFRLVKFLYLYHAVRGDLDQASQLAEQELEIVEREQSSRFLMDAYGNQAFVFFCRGEFKLAQEHFKKGQYYYEPERHETNFLPDGVDTATLSLVTYAHDLCLLGYPDQALKLCWDAVDLAQKRNHPVSHAVALAYLTMLYQFRQETDQVTQCAEECLAMVTRYNIGYYQRWANIFRTWSQAWKNPGRRTLMKLQNALDDFRAIGARLRWPYYLSLLALIYEKVGQIEEAVETINRAFAAAARHNENWWNAELYRLRGHLLLLQGDRDWAEEAYQQAISLAREQESLLLQLRAAMSLARLWQAQGRVEPAYELLATVYHQFTEGFDTPELQEAQALLADLTS